MIKWIAATALDLGQGSLRPYLPSMLHVVGREVNDKSAQAGKSLLINIPVHLLKPICTSLARRD